MSKYYSTNKEYYGYDNTHDALDTFSYSNEKIGDIVTIYEGELNVELAAFYLPEISSELMEEQSYDQVGELCDEWPNLNSELEKELKDAINETVNKWFTKHNLHPSFGTIENVKKLEYIITSLDDVDLWELKDNEK